MHPMLNTAIKAARRAGNTINRASVDIDRLQIGRKGPSDYVTDVDAAVEESIIEALSTAYPDHGFLGEESGERAPLQPRGDGEPENIWVIDPIDGTTNFIHGFPYYAVSIAMLHKGVPTHAVIYDPNHNEIFHASRGSGAFVNDRRVRVSGSRKYPDALLGAHVNEAGGVISSHSPFAAMLSDCAAVRRMGSTVLDLAYVACGRLDGFVATKVKPWDMAAGALLVLEAGGLVSDYQGEQDWYQSGQIIAATPKIFTQMLAHFQE
ncbi:inositol monophosphatase [Paenalcaligenes niemegkensis]|uniref:inositol monophosphatase family protein n=1 Tax=Paenalcaligenes niemegkensis TaxID=2895469 RepID=UPI001EE81490|nr:inositol monophosphatase family protein [Paenalcaligenes niemegkensis]MCQ9615756.1 inositol monophosphatase [Paenalcaligenes niemegkensis]